MNISTIEIIPHSGSPYEVKATISKYAIDQNGELPVLQESIRFRFDIGENVARLGDVVLYDCKEWVLGHAQVFYGARRIVTDGFREALDTRQCQPADIYRWETVYGCDAGEEPVLVKPQVSIAVMPYGRTSINLSDSRQVVDNYRIYLDSGLVKEIDHLTLIRADLDYKVQTVNDTKTPGKLAWIEAQDYDLTLAQI